MLRPPSILVTGTIVTTSSLAIDTTLALTPTSQHLPFAMPFFHNIFTNVTTFPTSIRHRRVPSGVVDLQNWPPPLIPDDLLRPFLVIIAIVFAFTNTFFFTGNTSSAPMFFVWLVTRISRLQLPSSSPSPPQNVVTSSNPCHVTVVIYWWRVLPACLTTVCLISPVCVHLLRHQPVHTPACLSTHASMIMAHPTQLSAT